MIQIKYLPDLCENLDFRRKPITEKDRVEGEIPYYGASGVVDYVDGYIFDEELLLVSEDGANLLARSTPIAFSIKGKTWVNNHAHVLKFSDKLIQKYVELYLNSISLEPYVTGSAQPKLNQKRLNEIPIPLPELNIMSNIIEAISQINELIALRKEQLTKLDQLVKSRFIELFGDPVYNNNGLPTKKLCELGSLDRGRSQHRPRNDPKLLNGPYPLIQTGEVASAGLYITEYKNTYSELGLQQSKMWKAGTLCITIAANIAQTAILTFDACFPDSVVGFVPNDAVSAIYMHYWFGFFQKILEEQAPQVAQKNINLKILSDLDVMVPKKEHQEQFAAFVEQTDKSKLAIQQSLDKLELLKKSLMQRYFG